VDVIARTQLEEMILECRPTMVFVEHDPAFVGRVATRVIELGAR
jgi:lincosamide and streptogramin A transport system ATP-binding/permease protein